MMRQMQIAMPTASSVDETSAHNVNNSDTIFPTAAVPIASVSGDTNLSPVDNYTCCGSTCSSGDTDIARWFPITHNTVSFWFKKDRINAPICLLMGSIHSVRNYTQHQNHRQRDILAAFIMDSFIQNGRTAR